MNAEAHTQEEQGERRTRLRDAYRDGLQLPSGTELHLAAALHDTLHHPGGLVRADLAFRMAAAYGLASEQADRLAISLEYFHTASLVFDDLPAMDDATHRRGNLCLHRVYGESTAILSALALINRAYALFWRAIQDQPARERSAASAFLENFLGLQGLLDGQSRDLHFGNPDGPADSAQNVALEKTASLIRLPLVLPALLGGARLEEQRLLNRLAALWGLAYQALDDLKDVLQGQDITGKTTGRDQQLQRPNVALELGLEPAMARLQRLAGLADRTLSRLQRLRPALGFLAEIATRLDQETRTLLQAAESAAVCSS